MDGAIDHRAAEMDLHACEMAGIRMKLYVDLALEHLAQASADSILFSWGQGRS